LARGGPFGKKLSYAANRAERNIPQRLQQPVPWLERAERRHARDERDSGCGDQPLVGDDDPVMHPYASVPDLAALIGPRYGSASFQ
jgi:hypothetical protein